MTAASCFYIGLHGVVCEIVLLYRRSSKSTISRSPCMTVCVCVHEARRAPQFSVELLKLFCSCCVSQSLSPRPVAENHCHGATVHAK